LCPIIADGLQSRENGFPAAVVDIKTVTGQVFSRQVDHAYGTVGNPMSTADVISKFRYCCRYSANPIPEDNQEKAIKLVTRLEKVNDVGRIPRLLGQRTPVIVCLLNAGREHLLVRHPPG
jgi:2-methylcitrate dehydratase PrpD